MIALSLVVLPATRADGQLRRDPAAAAELPASLLLDRLDEPLQREMTGGEAHRYLVPLAAGQYVHIVIRQLGIDVIPTLFDPQGQELLKSDAPTASYGSEVVRWIAVTEGTYRLEIRSFESDAIRGCYELRLEALRAPTPEDRILFAGEVAFSEAFRLDQQEDEESRRRALDKYLEAFALFRRGGDLAREALALDWAAQDYFGFREYSTALDYYEEALQSSRAAGDESVEAQALYMLGTVETSVGRTPEAIAHFESTLLIARRIGDSAMEVEILSNLGRLQEFLGEKERALDLYQLALSVSREMRMHNLEGRTLNRLGSLYQSGGEKTKALRAYLQALAVARSDPDRTLEAIVLSSIGRVIGELGDPQRALRNLGRALEIVRRNGDRHAEATILFEIGKTHASQGDARKALEDFSAALPLARAVSDPRLEAAVLNASGGILAEAGRLDQALELFDQGLAIARNTKDPYREADIRTSRGALLGRVGRTDEGLEELRRAIFLRRRLRDKLGEAAALYESALIESGRRNLKEGRDLAQAAIDAFESVRGRVAVPELRASFLGSVQKYYELYVDLLMSSDQATGQGELAARALEVSERAKARTLLDLLTEAGADIRSGVDPRVLERERSLSRRLQAGTERQMRAAEGRQPEKDSEKLISEIDSLTDELQQVEAEIRETSPRYAALTQPEPLDLVGIQRETLDERTVLLEYALGERRSFLWAVTRDTVKRFLLPPRIEIEQAAQRLHALWSSARKSSSSGGAGTADRQAEVLSRMVLGPAGELLGSKRLLIVADGALQLIPFAALPSPLAIGKKRSREVLIDGHEIVSLPSASVLALQRRELGSRAPAAKTLAVLADPVFERDDTRLGKRGDREAARKTNKDALERGIEQDGASVAGLAASEGGFRISRLPLTRREAKAILRLAPASDRMEALDFAASVTTAKSEELADYRHLHFATHGLINSLHPELSGIVLSLFDLDGHEQDGFLSTLDVFNMRLPADLVVLSACRTGLGKEIRGEGLVGLTRAFMYAGAKRVVASLWKVDDAATADLMTRFYAEMLGPRHLTPAAALRRAQISVKRQKRWEHPSYWAAFTLLGEWD
jgi:CHAT domain-containing protein/tetratricopeptide (TPR) repeat protein